MEIKEFAERLLLGNTLEDKLFFADQISDKDLSPFTIRIDQPSRPDFLQFSNQNAPLPKMHQLDDERQRGLLLHFFANHELLAIELMALALLRFPDAPPAFRRGIVHTISEEQGHVKLYMQRMKECGVALGDIPLNDFFWKVMKDMKTPLDYVTQMALTLEQANLDFSKFYMHTFEKIGDLKTAKVLKQVYEEEIGHVSYGLTWFRRWKDQGKSDWNAFESNLKLPLSPARAKGTIFDREGRVAAGFDEDFLRHIEVHSQSKGRPPSILYFHSCCEKFWAKGLSFNPGKQQKMVDDDLETLMMFFAAADDLVVVEKKPSIEHLRYLKKYNIRVPEFVENDSKIIARKDIDYRHFHKLKPWGWSPMIERKFQNFSQWSNVVKKEAFSKVASIALLIDYLKTQTDERLIPLRNVGRVCQSLEQVKEAILTWRAEGLEKFICKAPLGASGQNMIRLFEQPLEQAQENWLQNTLTQQGNVIVEPYVDSISEFSFHFESVDGELADRGFTRLVSDIRGQYAASLIGDPLINLSNDVKRFIHAKGESLLLASMKSLGEFLKPWVMKMNIEGPVAIDVMVYKQGEAYFLKPIQEINPRYTMGRLALQLNKQICGGIISLFKLERTRNPKAFAEEQQLKYPIEYDSKARIKSGLITLNDPSQATAYQGNLYIGAEAVQAELASLL